MVRFGKNGSDATAAAVRIARAFTGRERILVCGYHGWQDWYIGSTTRHLGVPKCVRELTHAVPYGDLAAVEAALVAHKGEVAALVMEPVNVTIPPEGYLSDLKALLHKHGALLVFDEIITGFRVHIGGAQAHFGVTPDLACFGKALGNGMPLSAIAGRADVMALMTEIFFSGTFGGEALSLAAAKAVLAKMRREPVIAELWRKGQELSDAVEKSAAANGLTAVIAMKGLAPWKILAISDHKNAEQAVIRTYVQKQMIQHGVLLLGSHNVCYAHTQEDIDHVIWAWERTLLGLARELEKPGLVDRLGCEPVRPVFRPR
jgi:glutamate-1-semialdehyde 2,1-aminomutase/spore coat polysaccharide biosynthesis protein SpsF